MDKKPTTRHSDCITPMAVSLLIIFVILRLCGVTSWSWWWVISPLWIWVIIILALNIIFVICLSKKNGKRK